MTQQIDYKLLEKAKKDKMLVQKLATMNGKSKFDMFNILDNAHEKITDDIYKEIIKWFKQK